MRLVIVLSVFLSCFFGSGVEAAAPKKQPVKRKTPMKQAPLIVVDAGHGGHDLGTNSNKTPIYEEKTLTLQTAKLVNENLKLLGYRTKMVRTDDTFIELKKRAEIANRCGARLFVSVHYNSAPKPASHGIEVFYYKAKGECPRASKSRKLADSVLAETIRLTEAKNRGVKHGNFAVIRETEIPAVLIEAGFLTNADERKKIMGKAYQKKIAWGIARGIDEYIKGSKTAPTS